MIALASRWVALVGAGLLLSVGALAEPGASSKSASGPISAEARLEAIRAELIEAATKARTRVRSVAWIDANGSLQEAARFTSDVQVRGVRGVRVNSYLAPQVDMGPDLEALPTPSAEACAEDMGNHRRHALFRVLPGVPGPFLSNAQIAQFSQSFGQELVSLLAAETGWSLTVAKSSSYAGQSMSRYEEALVRRVQDDAPYVVTVQLQDLGILPPEHRHGVVLDSLKSIGLTKSTSEQGLLGLTVVLSDRATGQ
ncbi:MAG: hypothetical protein ACO3UZ_06985, partial [Burkholderiaceae bacterium]